MTAVRIGLLAVAVVGVLIGPRPVPPWVAPAAMLGLGLGVGAVDVDAVGDALDPLIEPLGFLLLAVPLRFSWTGSGSSPQSPPASTAVATCTSGCGSSPPP